MNREEFLQGLQKSLSGNVPPQVVRENLQYYQDYISTEQQKGRTEADIMEELGEPRLIARTIMDTTPGAEEGGYEEYRGAFSGNAYGGNAYGGSSYSGATDAGDSRSTQGSTGSSQGGIHYYDLSKWYWKLLGILLVVGIVTVVITIVTGLLSLVIPMLPIIGLVILIMWFVQGPRR